MVMDANEELLTSIATSLNVLARLSLASYERGLDDADADDAPNPLALGERDKMYSYLEDTTIR